MVSFGVNQTVTFLQISWANNVYKLTWEQNITRGKKLQNIDESIPVIVADIWREILKRFYWGR